MEQQREGKNPSVKKLFLLLLLLFAPSAEATDRYVKTGCTNGISTYSPGADTCTGGSSLVYSSIANAITPAAAGDQIYIRAANYAENFTTAQLAAKSSTAYATALTIQAYQAEVVTIKPTVGNPCFALGNTGATLRYIIFKNLICDGSNNSATASDIDGADIGGGSNGGTIDHLKWDNVEVKNWSGSGAVLGGEDNTGNFLWWTGASVHDVGTSTVAPADRHAFYIVGSNTLIELVNIYNVERGYGIHNYGGTATPSNNTYRRLAIHNTGTDTSQSRFAIGLYVGSNNLAYNNILYANQNGIDVNGTGQLASNNTLYVNGVGFVGPGCCYPAVKATSGSGHFLQNNLLVSNQDNTVDTTGSSGTTSTPNTFSTSPSTVFVDASISDFRLKTGSAGINAGADLSPTFTTDYTGATRVIIWSSGAYKYITGTPIVVKLPSTPTALRLGSATSFKIGLTP